MAYAGISDLAVGGYVNNPAAWRARGNGIATPTDLKYSGLLQQHPEWWDMMAGNPAWDNHPDNPRFVTAPSSLTLPRNPVAQNAALQMNGLPVLPTPSAVGTPFGGVIAPKPGLDTLYKSYADAEQPKKQSLTEFTAALLKEKPAREGAYRDESNFLGSLFSEGGQGSAKAELDRIARQRAAAGNEAARMATRGALRNYNVGRMTGGDSSYLDRSYVDTLARIANENAQRYGDSQLSNFQYLTGLRNNNVGRRNQLLDQYLNDLLTQTQGYNSLIRDDASTLGQLGALSSLSTVPNNRYISFNP